MKRTATTGRRLLVFLLALLLAIPSGLTAVAAEAQEAAIALELSAEDILRVLGDEDAEAVGADSADLESYTVEGNEQTTLVHFVDEEGEEIEQVSYVESGDSSEFQVDPALAAVVDALELPYSEEELTLLKKELLAELEGAVLVRHFDAADTGDSMVQVLVVVDPAQGMLHAVVLNAGLDEKTVTLSVVDALGNPLTLSDVSIITQKAVTRTLSQEELDRYLGNPAAAVDILLTEVTETVSETAENTGSSSQGGGAASQPEEEENDEEAAADSQQSDADGEVAGENSGESETDQEPAAADEDDQDIGGDEPADDGENDAGDDDNDDQDSAGADDADDDVLYARTVAVPRSVTTLGPDVRDEDGADEADDADQDEEDPQDGDDDDDTDLDEADDEDDDDESSRSDRSRSGRRQVESYTAVVAESETTQAGTQVLDELKIGAARGITVVSGAVGTRETGGDKGIDKESAATISGIKTATLVGAQADGVYDVTLEITSTPHIKWETTTEVVSASVVIVLDMSNSMASNKRWTTTVEAVEEMVDALLGDGTLNEVAVVGYGSSNSNKGNASGMLIGFTNDADEIKNQFYNNFDHKTGKVIDVEEAQSRSGIASGGTNCQAGFIEAAKVLEDASGTTQEKFVVFLSDGVANTYYDEKTGKEAGSPTSTSYVALAGQRAISSANAIKHDATIFTVGLDLADSSKAHEMMSECASIDEFYTPTTVGNLVKRFSQLGIEMSNTKTTYSNHHNVTLSDPMSEYVDLIIAKGVTVEWMQVGTTTWSVVPSDLYKLQYDARGIELRFEDDKYEDSYTYRITYQVQVKEEHSGQRFYKNNESGLNPVPGTDGMPLNGYTWVSSDLMNWAEQDIKVPTGYRQYSLGSTVQILKVDETSNPLAGFKFNALEASASVNLGTTASGGIINVTANTFSWGGVLTQGDRTFTLYESRDGASDDYTVMDTPLATIVVNKSGVAGFYSYSIKSVTSVNENVAVIRTNNTTQIVVTNNRISLGADRVTLTKAITQNPANIQDTYTFKVWPVGGDVNDAKEVTITGAGTVDLADSQWGLSLKAGESYNIREVLDGTELYELDSVDKATRVDPESDWYQFTVPQAGETLAIKFTNTYPTRELGNDLTITITKQVNGGTTWAAGETFPVVLTNDNFEASGYINAQGTFVWEETTDKNFPLGTYTITEKVPANSLYQYDKTYVQINDQTVQERGTFELTKDTDSVAIEIHNISKGTDVGEAQVTVQKLVDYVEDEDVSFSITLTATGEIPVTLNVSAKDGVVPVTGALKYDVEYTVAETNIPTGFELVSITINGEEGKTFKLTDLNAEVDIVVTNQRNTPRENAVTLTKAVRDNPAKVRESYTFKVWPVEGGSYEKAQSITIPAEDVDKAVDLAAALNLKPGESYYIREDVPADALYTFVSFTTGSEVEPPQDKEADYRFTVPTGNVTENVNLKATNTYTTRELGKDFTIDVTKLVNGGESWVESEEFQVVLATGEFRATAKIRYSEQGGVTVEWVDDVKVFPLGEYTITETDTGTLYEYSQTIVTMDDKDPAVSKTFALTADTVSVKIELRNVSKKTVSGNEQVSVQKILEDSEDTDTPFTITLTGDNKSEHTVTLSRTAGQTGYVTGLMYGVTYKVDEINVPAGFERVSITVNGEKTDNSFILRNSTDTVEIVVTNRAQTLEQTGGKATVTKSLFHENDSTSDNFNVVFTPTGSVGTELSVTLSAGQSEEIKGLLIGVTYEITEVLDNSGEYVNYQILGGTSGNTITPEIGKTYQIQVGNRRLTVGEAKDTSVAVRKELGDDTDSTNETFTVNFTPVGTNQAGGTVTQVLDSVRVNVDVDDLLVGVEYKIEELVKADSEFVIAGYTVNIDGVKHENTDTITPEPGKAYEIVVTNQRRAPAQGAVTLKKDIFLAGGVKQPNQADTFTFYVWPTSLGTTTRPSDAKSVTINQWETPDLTNNDLGLDLQAGREYYIEEDVPANFALNGIDKATHVTGNVYSFVVPTETEDTVHLVAENEWQTVNIDDGDFDLVVQKYIDGVLGGSDNFLPEEFTVTFTNGNFSATGTIDSTTGNFKWDDSSKTQFPMGQYTVKESMGDGTSFRWAGWSYTVNGGTAVTGSAADDLVITLDSDVDSIVLSLYNESIRTGEDSELVSISKTVTGTNATDDEFTIRLTGPNNEVVDVTVTAGGTVYASGLLYGETYTVSEVDIPANYSLLDIQVLVNGDEQEDAVFALTQGVDSVEILVSNRYSSGSGGGGGGGNTGGGNGGQSGGTIPSTTFGAGLTTINDPEVPLGTVEIDDEETPLGALPDGSLPKTGGFPMEAFGLLGAGAIYLGVLLKLRGRQEYLED